ncbi:MAG: enoyl-CoA hydratase-related protein [Actinomycetota bacterium]|nr:enoyl-CoA hydratase-related protein [Actinomycetota bacterium]
MSETEVVLVERDGGIATVILNRPEKRNAFNLAMCRRLKTVFAELSADEAVRCVVLRGAGDKAFTAGADINEFAQVRTDHASSRDYNETSKAAQIAVRDCRHPVIAMIRGYCLGGGAGFALMCDMRIATRSSQFGITAKKLANYYSAHAMEALLAAVGRPKALEILLEGEVFGAEEALRIGMVNRLVDDDALESEVTATAQRIADGAPLAARYHKKFLYRLCQREPLTPEELEEVHTAAGTEDYEIGYPAFQNKEKPRFVGR